MGTVAWSTWANKAPKADSPDFGNIWKLTVEMLASLWELQLHPPPLTMALTLPQKTWSTLGQGGCVLPSRQGSQALPLVSSRTYIQLTHSNTHNTHNLPWPQDKEPRTPDHLEPPQLQGSSESFQSLIFR